MVFDSFFTYLGYIVIVWYIAAYIIGKVRGRVTIEHFRHGAVAITGGSDGIGKGFAMELAARKFKVVIIGRNPDKMTEVCSEITSLTGNEHVKWIQADFAYSHRDPEAFYSDLYSKLKPFNISVLINNVGIADIKPISELTYEQLEKSVGINVFPQTHLTHKLFPDFVKRYNEEKLRSLIINLSSFAGRVPFAEGSVYCATKRYNDYFSRATGLDNPEAIMTLSLTPLAVATDMPSRDFGQKKNSVLAVQVSTWVKSALASIGEEQTYAHWSHKIQGACVEILPDCLRGKLVSMSRSTLSKI